MAKKTKKARAAKKGRRTSAPAKGKTVPVDAVVRFVKRLDELKQLEEFLGLAKKSRAFVTLRGGSFNMVRSFVEQKRQTGEAVLQARRSGAARRGVIDPCDGFECF